MNIEHVLKVYIIYEIKSFYALIKYFENHGKNVQRVYVKVCLDASSVNLNLYQTVYKF